MLEKPGNRRRRRFYHRIGIVTIPTFRLHEAYIVPASFFSNEPQPEDVEGGKPKTRVVDVTTLMLRLIDILYQMMQIEQREARAKKARARARRAAKWINDQDENESPASIVEKAIADILAMPDYPEQEEEAKMFETEAEE